MPPATRLGFQFLMVQLKGLQCIRRAYRVLPFQFLMVQLKESFTVGDCNFTFISIPYGSIKRKHGLFTSPPFDISIPYGSIKSELSGCW